MNPFKTTLITCFSIFGVIAVGFLLFGDYEKFPMIGISGLVLSVLYLVAGLLLCIPSSSRKIGMGLLLSSGIILIIGLSVCSLSQVNMNLH